MRVSTRFANHILRRLTAGIASGAALSALLVASVFAVAPASADEFYEWGNDEWEDEWYDPSDWFDGNNVEWDDQYDTNWGWGDYNYGYDANDYDYGDYDYDYDANTYGDDYEYGWHYDELTNDWEYGYHYDDTGSTDYYNDGLGDYDYNDSDYAEYDYGDNDLDYGWHYDETTNDWQYGYHYDEFGTDYDYDYTDTDYNYNKTIRGEVVGLQRISASADNPESVALRIRTDDGSIRNLRLGDTGYVSANFPEFQKGDRISIRGHMLRSGDRGLFRATEIHGNNGSFDMPQYQFSKTVNGRIVGIKNVAMRNGELQAVVARVRTDDGTVRDVLLGSPSDLRKTGIRIRPNGRIAVEGWTRTVGDDSKFFVRNVRVLDQGQQNEMRDQQQRQQQARQQQQMRQERDQQQQARQQQQMRQQRDRQQTGWQDRDQQRQQQDRRDMARR